MDAIPSESAQIASTSIPRTVTSALGTIYDSLVSDWGAPEESRDQCCSQAAAKRRQAEAQRSGRMLWIRKEKVFTRFDYDSTEQRCRHLDLDVVSSDVRRENPEATPPLFCHHLGLVV